MSGSTWLIRYQGADKMFDAVRIFWLKFIYSEKATKFCKIFILLLTVCTLKTYFRQHFELEKLLELEKVEFEKVVAKSDFLEPNLPL